MTIHRKYTRTLTFQNVWQAYGIKAPIFYQDAYWKSDVGLLHGSLLTTIRSLFTLIWSLLILQVPGKRKGKGLGPIDQEVCVCVCVCVCVIYIYIYIYIYEKGIQYHYVDVSKIPPELLTYLRMYCNSYPIVLGVKYCSTFNETLEHFQDI